MNHKDLLFLAIRGLDFDIETLQKKREILMAELNQESLDERRAARHPAVIQPNAEAVVTGNTFTGKKTKKKRKMSAEGKARIAAATTKRWAEWRRAKSKAEREAA